MQGHLRFQGESIDVTDVSLSLSLSLSLLLLLLLLTKVTHAHYRKRFRASYNMHNLSSRLTRIRLICLLFFLSSAAATPKSDNPSKHFPVS